ncbi:MAG: GNAT family N-acetyltransferase [Novosphingobium sp.]
MAEFRLETERLILREWREEDIAPFQRICSDPDVMATLGPPLDLSATTALVGRLRQRQEQFGYCLWAVERGEDARLIGWCGLTRGAVGPIEGKLEIGWRLAHDCWGKGLATEGARASLDWAFANLGNTAIWAMTAQINSRSRAVMERLKMRYRPDLDFDHPSFPPGHPLREHIVYAIDRPQ